MLTRTLPTFGSRRARYVFERNFAVYRSQWLMFLTGFFEPFFYLLSIGIGLNHLVGTVHFGSADVTYAAFVAPGMLVTSSMNGAVIDSIFNTFFKLKVSRSYDAILATPLDINDVALGEMLWALSRAAIYSLSFIGCMALLGDVSSWWVLLCWPVAMLTSLAFTGLGLAGASYLRTWQDFDLVFLVQLPLFLFSATFFPITLYPRALGAVVWCSPLYQAATLARGVALGHFDGFMVWRALYLAGLGLFGLWLAARRFGRILVP